MGKKQLQDYIEQLNNYLSDIEVTELERLSLLALIKNIENQLIEQEAIEPPDTLSEQVDELATVFEAEHPTLTGVLKNIMVTLASMGV